MDNASVKQVGGSGIESHCGQEFFILKFSLVLRAAQHNATMQMKSTLAYT